MFLMKLKHFAIATTLALAVCFSFFTKNTFAINPIIVISEIKTGGSTEPKQFVELYNNDSQAIDLSKFVIEYAKPGAQIKDGCTASVWQDLNTPSNIHASNLSDLDNPIIQPYSYLVIDVQMNDNVSGSVRLIQTLASETIVYDLVGWGGSASGAPCVENTQAPMVVNNKSIKRYFNNSGHPIDTDNNFTDFVLSDTPGTEASTPPMPGMGSGVLCDNQLQLSEFLTDPVGLEADGGEFVELYNPATSEASLLGCHLQSSHSSSDLIIFTQSDIVPAMGYFTVPLTNKLINKQGYVSFESANNKQVVNYSDMGEGQSDSFINGSWQITDKPTPGAVNRLVNLIDKQGIAASPAPCPSGKFRNPATNRCKNISSKKSSLKPCASNQYRNSVTNRCRLISTATTSRKPCAANQVRNPETNRCRKISTAITQRKPCKPGYVRNPETNRCRKDRSSNSFAANFSQPASLSSVKASPTVALVVAGLAVGYGIYEYRQEIWRGWYYLRNQVFKPPDSS